MVYTIFIKKNEQDINNELVKLIKSYYQSNQNSFILGWPGYIGTTPSSLDAFYNIFKTVNNNPQGFFFQPLNQKNINNNITNIDYINRKFGNYNLTQKQRKDHSKIITFLNFNESYSKFNFQELIKHTNYKVDCLFIGSSNQSYNTYCKTPALKGEMDVCIIKLSSDEELKNFINTIEIKLENIIVSKEMDNITKVNLTKIVSKILSDTLN